MKNITHKELLESVVHFGHLKKKWNPKMSPYIFMEKKGIHIIDLNKTITSLKDAAAALKSIAASGKKILFVGTKKQAHFIVKELAEKVGMPYATERWLGGMLTNFSTIRKSVKKIQTIEKILADTEAKLGKKERLTLSRKKDKIEKVLGGISGLNRLPAAIFIVDIMHEHIALAEANKLNITTFAMVDTNSDPTAVDFPIPANDDSTRSVKLITDYIGDAIIEGLAERGKNKEAKSETEDAENKEATSEKKSEKKEVEKKAAPKTKADKVVKKDTKPAAKTTPKKVASTKAKAEVKTKKAAPAKKAAPKKPAAKAKTTTKKTTKAK